MTEEREQRAALSVIRISLTDAANNCIRESATAYLTLRSGVVISGKLEKASHSFPATAHLKTDSGGWVTVDIEEIAAVEARPPQRF